MAIAHRANTRSRAQTDDDKTSLIPYAPATGIEALGTAGICVAVGVLLPMFVHSLGLPPRAFLPMHFPVFLAGVLLAPQYAALVGIMAPALASGFTGQPTLTQAVRMVPELTVMALTTSFMLRMLPSLPGLPRVSGRIGAIVTAMIVAMIASRLVYVAVAGMISGFENLDFYASVLLLPAIPGIIAQLIVVPPLAWRLQRVMDQS